MPRDIEEFLKLAAQRRQQQKQQSGGQPPRRPPPPRSPVAPQPVRPVETVRVLEQTDHSDAYQQSSGSEPVRHKIDTSRLGDHARQLGEEVGLADDKLDSRLHQTFDHNVVSLRPGLAHNETTSTTVRATSGIAMDLFEMFRSPRSVRQAILISEILRRPDLD